jgi:hypothetical protein
MVTMSQKSSVLQAAKSVSQALMADNFHVIGIFGVRTSNQGTASAWSKRGTEAYAIVSLWMGSAKDHRESAGPRLHDTGAAKRIPLSVKIKASKKVAFRAAKDLKMTV